MTQHRCRACGEAVDERAMATHADEHAERGDIARQVTFERIAPKGEQPKPGAPRIDKATYSFRSR